MKIRHIFSGTLWAVCCGVLYTACTETAPVHTSHLYLLAGDSAKTWHMLSDSSYRGLETNPCLLDNEYVFTTTGEFVSTDKGISCSPRATDMVVRLPWVFNSDSTMLTFGGQARMRIVSLSDTTMVIEELSLTDSTAERKTVFTAVR